MVLAVVNMAVRSHYGEQPGTWRWSWTDDLSLVVLAIPALVGPIFTRVPILRVLAALCAVLAWAPLIDGMDLTCTDCGFMLLYPVQFVLPQIGLIVVSLIARAVERRRGSLRPTVP